MMKTLIKTSVATLILLSASPALALTINANAKVEGTMKPSTTSGSVSAKAEEARGQMKDNIKQRTENRYEKMLARFKLVIDRETSIMNKINSRIAKIKANGGNTTEAEKLTADAKIELDAATAGLATLTAEANAQANLESASTTVIKLREGLNTMKKTGAEIEKHLRAAHQDLLKCVGKLLGMSQLNATTTKIKVESNTEVEAH
jgi:F0F1-type ATP synthase membrane subunit b/b'